MFFAKSRYEKIETYPVELTEGKTVVAVKMPRPRGAVLRGYHRRTTGERNDLIAYRYLNDATMFWRLCDASDAMVPDALAARDLVAVPEREG